MAGLNHSSVRIGIRFVEQTGGVVGYAWRLENLRGLRPRLPWTRRINGSGWQGRNARGRRRNYRRRIGRRRYKLSARALLEDRRVEHSQRPASETEKGGQDCEEFKHDPQSSRSEAGEDGQNRHQQDAKQKNQCA